MSVSYKFLYVTKYVWLVWDGLVTDRFDKKVKILGLTKQIFNENYEYKRRVNKNRRNTNNQNAT